MDEQTAPVAPSPLGRVGAATARLGGKLGIGVAVLGFVAIFLGWNGAASFNDLRQQFPYLISGGLTGLALVTIGAALLVVENSRAERTELLAAVGELTRAVEAMAGAGAGAASHVGAAALLLAVPEGHVVAGASSYHRPGCRLVEGRAELTSLSPEAAEAAGLTACRVCDPAEPPIATIGSTDDRPRRQLRAR